MNNLQGGEELLRGNSGTTPPGRAGRAAVFAATLLASSGCVITYDDELNPPRALSDPGVVTGPLNPGTPDPLDVFSGVRLPDGRRLVPQLEESRTPKDSPPLPPPPVDRAAAAPSDLEASSKVQAREDNSGTTADSLRELLPIPKEKLAALEWAMERTWSFFSSTQAGNERAFGPDAFLNPASMGIEFWLSQENAKELSERAGIDLSRGNDRAWFQGHFLATFMTALRASEGDLHYGRLALYQHILGDQVNMLPSLREPLRREVKTNEAKRDVEVEAPAAPSVQKEQEERNEPTLKEARTVVESVSESPSRENPWTVRLAALREKTPLTEEQKAGFDWLIREVRSDVERLKTANPELSQMELAVQLGSLWLAGGERAQTLKDSLGLHLRHPPDLFWLRSHVGRISDLVALRSLLGGSEEQFQVALWQQCVLDCPFPESVKRRYEACESVPKERIKREEVLRVETRVPETRVDPGGDTFSVDGPTIAPAIKPSEVAVPRREDTVPRREDTVPRREDTVPSETVPIASVSLPVSAEGVASQEPPPRATSRRGEGTLLWGLFTVVNLLGAGRLAQIYLRTKKTT